MQILADLPSPSGRENQTIILLNTRPHLPAGPSPAFGGRLTLKNMAFPTLCKAAAATLSMSHKGIHRLIANALRQPSLESGHGLQPTISMQGDPLGVGLQSCGLSTVSRKWWITHTSVHVGSKWVVLSSGLIISYNDSQNPWTTLLLLLVSYKRYYNWDKWLARWRGLEGSWAQELQSPWSLGTTTLSTCIRILVHQSGSSKVRILNPYTHGMLLSVGHRFILKFWLLMYKSF